MPTRSRRACSHPGCFRKAAPGRGQCLRCVRDEDEERHPHRALYSSRAWRNASEAYRRENPLCAECLRRGEVVAGECVDHIIPHDGDLDLFWDRDNWQTLCNDCHGVKTQAEVAERKEN